MPADPSEGFRYRAFISYSHADATIAKRIHRTLEGFSPPRSIGRGYAKRMGLPKSLAPVFLDREEFASAAKLDDAIQEALSKSSCLIVLCSPASASSRYVNEEIRRFKAMGRSSKVFALLLQGEPNAEKRGFDASLECFPSALVTEFDSKGNAIGTGVEPLAADLRAGGDGRQLAMQKLIAAMLGVELDLLRHRLVRQARRRLLRAIAAGGVMAAVLMLGFGALSDAGFTLPFSDSARVAIDARRASLLRPVLPRERIRTEALRLAADYRKATVQDSGYLTLKDPDQSDDEFGRVWIHLQCVSALGRRRDNSEDADAARALCLRLKRYEELAGYPTAVNIESNPSLAEPQAWAVIALAQYARQGRLDENCTMLLVEFARSLREDFSNADGAWKSYRRTRDDVHESFYAAALAGAALLELLDANVLDEAGTRKTEEEVRATCRWLMERHEIDGRLGGWRGRESMEEADLIDGLTLQIYSMLLTASQRGLIVIPPEIVRPMTTRLIGCGDRSVDYPAYSIEQRGLVESGDGRTFEVRESIVLVWWPWAVEATRLALEQSKELGLSQLETYRLERSSSRLVADLGPELLRRDLANGTVTFMYGENMWALFGFDQEETSGGLLVGLDAASGQ